MPRRHLLTIHNILFTSLTIAFLVPKVLSTYHGATPSLNTMDWVFGGSIAILFFWLEKLMDHRNSDRWHWYFDEYFPSMTFHCLRGVMLHIRSRYRANSSTGTGSGDSIQLDFLDQNVTEASCIDDHASTERPTFPSYLEPTEIDLHEPGISHHTPVQTGHMPSDVETFERNPIFSEPQSNADPVFPASISIGESQPIPVESNGTVQRNISGTTEDDGSVDISSISRGSVDITSMPYTSRVPQLRNDQRASGIADGFGRVDVSSSSEPLLVKRGPRRERSDIHLYPLAPRYPTNDIPRNGSFFPFTMSPLSIFPSDGMRDRPNRNPCGRCRRAHIPCDQIDVTSCRRCKDMGFERCDGSDFDGLGKTTKAEFVAAKMHLEHYMYQTEPGGSEVDEDRF